MSTPINYVQCLQGNRMMRAAKAGDVEAVRRCLDSGTDVNSRRVIILYMTIDVFAWWLHDDHMLWCNDDIYYRRWKIVLFWVSLRWHYCRYRLITHINDHYWQCLNVVIIRQNVPNVTCMKRLIISYSLLSDISGGRQHFIEPLNMVNIIWINRKIILISRGCFLTKELWST